MENYYTKKTVFYTADKKEIGKNTSDTAEKKNAGENTSKTADKKETVKKTDFQPLKIPAVLNNMVFIHCFHNLNQSILKKDV